MSKYIVGQRYIPDCACWEKAYDGYYDKVGNSWNFFSSKCPNCEEPTKEEK